LYFWSQKSGGTGANKNFPALCAGPMPPAPHFQIRSGATGHGIFFKEYYPQFNSLFVLHDVSVQHGGVVSRQVQFSHFTAYIMKVGVFSDIAARMTFLLSDHCIASIQWRHRFYCVIDMIY